MTKLHVPQPNLEPLQDHLLFSPKWADHQIAKHFRDQLLVMEEIVREGSDLLMRCHAAAPGLGPEVVITVLFRQVLATADAVFLCLARGATAAADANLRHLLEARWGLRFALRDPAKWGLYVHVRTIRVNREAQRRFIEGTPEWERYAAARDLTKSAVVEYAAMAAAYDDAVAAADAKLAEDPFKPVSDAFDRARGKEQYEPNWYCDGSVEKAQRVSSVYQLAKAVKCQAEYETAYRDGSYAVHGGHESSHRVYEHAGVAVAPIRSPEGFRPAFIFGASQMVACMLDMLTVFIPSEVPAFALRAQAWQRTIMATPDLRISLAEGGGR